MAVATIKFLNEGLQDKFYFRIFHDRLARRLLKEDQYSIYATMGVPGLVGEAAAEEVFDIANNPSREGERDQLYGQARSVSVGDIVNVDGVDYVCAPVGWIKLD
jgi:hypothetical protein